MADTPAEVAILIVCHNSRRHIEDCLDSVLRSADGDIVRHLVVVDNASTDDSAPYVRTNFEQVDLLSSRTNLGFAGGNNLGWEFIRKTYPRTKYLALLNPDTIVRSGWAKAMVEHLDRDKGVGAVQARLMQYPRTDLFNSAGNRSHFLGFGFVTGCGQTAVDLGDEPHSIDFPSGAACMVRTDLVKQLGLFDDEMFLYLEDADLGWKLRQTGFDIVYVPSSVVYHKYDFPDARKFYYYLERNRWWLVLIYYKAPTLLLLAPALAGMELGQVCFAVSRRLIGQKLRSWRFFLRWKNLAKLRARRREVQARRRLGDRAFMGRFSGSIDSPDLNSPLLKYVANPLLGTYWRLVRRLIRW